MLLLRLILQADQKIRWDKVHIRPFDNVVKNNIELTSEADFESFYTDRIGSHFLNTHEKILENIRPWSIEKEGEK